MDDVSRDGYLIYNFPEASIIAESVIEADETIEYGDPIFTKIFTDDGLDILRSKYDSLPSKAGKEDAQTPVIMFDNSQDSIISSHTPLRDLARSQSENLLTPKIRTTCKLGVSTYLEHPSYYSPPNVENQRPANLTMEEIWKDPSTTGPAADAFIMVDILGHRWMCFYIRAEKRLRFVRLLKHVLDELYLLEEVQEMENVEAVGVVEGEKIPRLLVFKEDGALELFLNPEHRIGGIELGAGIFPSLFPSVSRFDASAGPVPSPSFSRGDTTNFSMFVTTNNSTIAAESRYDAINSCPALISLNDVIILHQPATNRLHQFPIPNLFFTSFTRDISVSLGKEIPLEDFSHLLSLWIRLQNALRPEIELLPYQMEFFLLQKFLLSLIGVTRRFTSVKNRNSQILIRQTTPDTDIDLAAIFMQKLRFEAQNLSLTHRNYPEKFYKPSYNTFTPFIGKDFDAALHFHDPVLEIIYFVEQIEFLLSGRMHREM